MRIIVIAFTAILLAATIPIGSATVPVATAQGQPSLSDYDKNGDGLISLDEVKAALDDYLVYGRADKPLAIAATASYLLGKDIVDLHDLLLKARGILEKPVSIAELQAALEASRSKLAAESAASSQSYMGAVRALAAKKESERLTKISDLQAMLDKKNEARLTREAACQIAPAPVITSLSVDHGQPNDPVLIEGQNFGATRSYSDNVSFLVAIDTWVTGKIEFWSPNQIMVTLPDTTMGLANSYQGVVKVHYCGMDSNLMLFRWDPTIVTWELDPCIDYYVHTKAFTGWQICCNYDFCYQPCRQSLCQVSHWGIFTCIENDDTFLENVRLVNNWVVDRVEFGRDISKSGEANAWVKESHVGTDNPCVKVHFYATKLDWVRYWVRVYIKGPAYTQPWEWR